MKKLISVTLLICLLLAVTPVGAQDAVYCFSADPVNAGKDTGYAKADAVTLDDPHFGWALGHFLISGFSARSGDGGLVFERRPGVPLTLSFALEQDIDALNGDRRLSVSADKNGYDQLFGIKKITLPAQFFVFCTPQYASGAPYANRRAAQGVLA